MCAIMMSEIRYNFIVPQERDLSLDKLENGVFEEFSHLYSRGEFIWGHQTYRALKDLGLPVSLSFDLNPDAINLAHGNVLRSMKRRADCFCVSLQADFPHFPLAHYHIVQNQEQVAKNAAFISHWPQPRQLVRDHTRSTVRKVAYQGARIFSDLDEYRLNSDLKKHDIIFEILDESEWINLSEVDVLVGIRSFGKKKYKRKPATKLIDAWHAGIPFIGGWDSAYTQIGVPGENYLRVSSYGELLDCIVQLKNDDQLYGRMVEAGEKRAVEFTFNATAQQWKNLLEGDISRVYSEWEHRPLRVLRYNAKSVWYVLCALLKHCIFKFYKVPTIKYLRDRYYDPVK